MTEVRKIQKFMLNQTLRRLEKLIHFGLSYHHASLEEFKKKRKELLIPVKLDLL